MKQLTNPYEILNKEIIAVEELYRITLWSYKNVMISESNESLNREEDGSLELLNDKNEVIKNYRNRGHLKADLIGKRVKELCSVLFVRLISALEVFLIDYIKYAFIKNPFLLASQKKSLEISYSKLISKTNISDLKWEIAEKETRKLHSSGFKDVVKYYNSQLNINISDLGVSLSKLELSHDKRHLLVHRLGKTDSSYRHKYNYTRQDIKITELDLEELIYLIRDSSKKINNAVENEILNKNVINNPNSVNNKITFELLIDSFPSILSQSYSFVVKDRYLCNNDLFTLEEGEGKFYTMHISSSYEDFTLIKSTLKRLQNRAILNIKSKTSNGIVKTIKLSDLPLEQLEEIARELPLQVDWYKGIHKDLASLKNISNNKSSSVFSSILEEESLITELGKNINPIYKRN